MIFGFVVPDLCGVWVSGRLSEGHAGPDRTQVCEPRGGHQVLRSRHVPQTRILKVTTRLTHQAEECSVRKEGSQDRSCFLLLLHSFFFAIYEVLKEMM